MSILEAARRLADHGLRDKHRGVCAVCEQWWTREDPGACPEIVHHLPDCPVPMLPQIVAALEAAEQRAALDPRLRHLHPEQIEYADLIRASNVARDHGPLSAIALRRRLGGRNVGYEIHLLMQAGCLEKMPASEGERWPVYRWVEP